MSGNRSCLVSAVEAWCSCKMTPGEPRSLQAAVQSGGTRGREGPPSWHGRAALLSCGRQVLAYRLTWLPMLSCPPKLTGRVARLLGLPYGKTPPRLVPAHPLSSVARLNGCLARERLGAAPLDFPLTALQHGSRGRSDMEGGTVVAGQGEAHAGDAPTSVPWAPASL